MLKLDFKILKWILLVSYLCILFGLVMLGYHRGLIDILASCKVPFVGDIPQPALAAFVLAVTLLTQALFILFSGTINLCKPLRKRRLLVPVALTGILFVALCSAAISALQELFRLKDSSSVWIAALIAAWIAWAAVFLVYLTGKARFRAAYTLITTLLAGTLLELMMNIPAHVIARKRGGCFAGLGTGIGIYMALVVMVWAFGPAVILLFLKKRYRKEAETKIKCIDEHSK